ncbi:MAG: HD domain-containing protein [Holophagales bacterium]|nr:HD domain-containing protein [Holophagales bacterium]
MIPIPRRPRLRIVTALIAVLVVVSIVPLAFSAMRLVSINREALETAEKQYLTRSAVTLSDGIEGFLRRMLVQVTKIGDGLELARAVAPDQDPFAFVGRTALIARYRDAEPSFLVLRALDADRLGGVIQPAQIDGALEEELNRAFAAAMRGSTYVGEALRVPSLLDPGIVIAVPVSAPEGGVVGVVEAFVSLAPIRALLELEKKRDLVAYIVDRRGNLVLASDVGAIGGSEPLLKVELVSEFVQHPVRLTRTYSRGEGPSARRVLGTVSPVGPAPNLPDWGVLVEKDVARAFAAATQMTRTSWLVAALAVALAVIAAFLAANALSRPVRALADSVRKMSEGDLTQRVEVPGTFELAELAEGFNHMGGELEKSVEKLKLAARENQELFLNSIRALAAAVDAKDPYTRGHSERVARYSVSIARNLGLPADEVRKVRIAALLHDVGKIGIDDRILRKPTALTDDEFEVMKLHPVKGALIMGQIPQLKWIIPGMKYHHEKWDGTGYPEGLAAEEIPMLARIISVADTFDAMTTSRPYQKAMKSDYVVSRIKTFAGTRYDTRVTDALEQAFASHELEVVGEAARQAVA